jgi:hypothetical protein
VSTYRINWQSPLARAAVAISENGGADVASIRAAPSSSQRKPHEVVLLLPQVSAALIAAVGPTGSPEENTLLDLTHGRTSYSRYGPRHLRGDGVKLLDKKNTTVVHTMHRAIR